MVALAIAAGGVLLVQMLPRVQYNRDDPDYERFSRTFSQIGEQLARRDAKGEAMVDFSNLNNGDWRIACVFGGYTNPLQDMQAFGADIREEDRSRLTKAGSGFRAGQVEEFEIMISYVDSANRTHFIHFPHGIGPQGQHLESCVSKPGTRLRLPTS